MKAMLLSEAGQETSGRVSRYLTFDLASGESISRQLTRALRRAIVTTRIKPGEMLSEQDIASTLGISRQPIREAIINLRELGLIRVFPQRGTQVLKISPKAVEDARFIREAVECAVVREAALKADFDDIYRLHDNIALQRRSLRIDDPEAFFDLDEDFHRLLAATAKRPSTWDFIEMVKPQVDRVRFLDLDDHHSQESNVAEHAALVEAVENHDPAKAEQAMQEHLRSVRKALLRIKTRSPDMFESD
ncbi:MAG: GntR family transcriptional regulator [Rhizobiaceae bacterium]